MKHLRLTFTDEQRAEIAHRYKQEKNPRFRERLHCLLLKDLGHTNLEVAQILFVVPDTITDWLRLYDRGGIEALCSLETGGSDGFLSEEQIAQLKDELDKHLFQSAKQVCAWVYEFQSAKQVCAWVYEFQSAKQVCAWVYEQFAVAYSERGMRDLLKRLGYTRQKAHLVPAQADVEAQAAFLKGV